MELANATGLTCLCYTQVDAEGLEQTVVAARGTYQLDGDGLPKLAEEQAFFQLTDAYYAQPQCSSLRVATEMYYHKECSDIFFVDPIAKALGGRPTTGWDVSVRVGRVATRFAVTGPRHWYRSRLGGWRLGEPEAVSDVSLRFEKAFGGSWFRDGKAGTFQPNPVGLGFVDPEQLKHSSELPAPQLFRHDSPPNAPNQGIAVVGLTPIAPGWQTRAQFAGTPTEAWRDDPWSAYAPGFDTRFFNVAPPDLQYPGYVAGGESVEINGLHEAGRCEFCLPLCPALCLELFCLNGKRLAVTLHPDTVSIDLSAALVVIVWRVHFRPPGQVFYAALQFRESR